jgi:hypothetical protein
VFVLGTALSPAQAQYPGGGYPGSSGSWVPSDSSGNPLPSGDRRLNSDGGAYLTPSGKQPNLSNTYPIPDSAAQWWFGAFSPNKYSANSGSEYGSPSLSLYGDADNSTTDEYGSGPVCFYDPNSYSDDRPDNIPLPPDLLGSAHGDTSDTLTAYFVWTGPDPAPDTANFIVHTSVSANAYVGSSSGQTAGLSATATASLGGDSVTATAGDAGSSGNQAKEGYHVVQASVSGLVAQVPMSGSVSVDSSNSLRYGSWVDSAAGPGSSGPGTYYYSGPGSGPSSASDSATASATAYPITLNLSGGIGSSTAKRLLIGQQFTATLSTGPLTQSAWNWTVSGGSPFKNYQASDASAVYTPLGSEISNSLVCYFAKPTTSATVSCAAHLDVPAGASPTGGLDVTVTQKLTVDKPNSTGHMWIGHPTDLPTSSNPSEVELQRFYFPTNNVQARGVEWQMSVTTLTPYAAAASGDWGSWNWTQLVTPGRQRKNNGVYEQLARTSVTPYQIVNGVQCLDGQYPYGREWFPADGTTKGDADSPDEPLEAGFNVRAKDVLDSFVDYFMYRPPGSASVPVPLENYQWFWEFHATKDNADLWNDTGQAAQWGELGPFPAFPQWTFPLTTSTYVAP